VIGQATKDVVNKMVDGIVTPALQLLLPNSEIQDLVITSNGAEFRIGEFIDALIQMFIIMLLIYIIFGLVFKDKKVVGSKKAKKKLHKNKNT
jgi:large conductance mechanosensitive channel